MAQKTAAEEKHKQGRSPGSPKVDLRRALELTRTVYEQTKLHPVAVEAVFHAWKLKPKSGQAATTIAALKYFGLLKALSQRGPDSGKVMVSELARNILIDKREGSEERTELIREAALMPKIHDDLWKQYGGELPENQALRFHLLRDLRFTESGVDDFITQFRSTLTFAGLVSGDVQSDENGDKVEAVEGTPMTTQSHSGQFPARPSSGLREVPIPIPGSAWPMLKAGFPLTEDAWDQMLEVLKAMKPGLVQPKQGS